MMQKNACPRGKKSQKSKRRVEGRAKSGKRLRGDAQNGLVGGKNETGTTRRDSYQKTVSEGGAEKRTATGCKKKENSRKRGRKKVENKTPREIRLGKGKKL